MENQLWTANVAAIRGLKLHLQRAITRRTIGGNVTNEQPAGILKTSGVMARIVGAEQIVRLAVATLRGPALFVHSSGRLHSCRPRSESSPSLLRPVWRPSRGAGVLALFASPLSSGCAGGNPAAPPVPLLRPAAPRIFSRHFGRDQPDSHSQSCVQSLRAERRPRLYVKSHSWRR